MNATEILKMISEEQILIELSSHGDKFNLKSNKKSIDKILPIIKEHKAEILLIHKGIK